MKYLENLNEKQKEAALYTEGPLLIIAGAGAGKTKTITHRIAHLVEKGIPAHAILAVTFTNKAAGEMRERVRSLVPKGRGIPLVTTFHSLGVRILREFHAAAGLPRAFTIWDRDDSMRALKRIVENIGSDLPPRSALAAISRQKGDGVSLAEYAEAASDYCTRGIARIWEKYDKELAQEGALDFDDLLLRTLQLLQTSKEVRTLLQNRYRYLTIDEYQDTNKSQYEIARLLAGEERNICVVGDIDQNIYSWRGALIDHLLEFEKNFPGTKVVLLEQNYRSTRTILAAANSVIEKNRRRIPKNLFTDNPVGEAISVFAARNEIEEAWFVADRAARLIASGVPPKEMAVLYRENFQSRALEEAMLAAGIPYRVLGTRFFERKEVKDVLSYLRAAGNDKSRVDMMRIVGVPARGIGKVTLEKLLAGQSEALSGASGQKVAAFRDTLRQIKHAIEQLPCSEAVAFAAEKSGIEAMLKNQGDEGKERLDNVRELVNFAARFDDEQPPEGTERLLEEAALQSEQDELSRDERNSVSLMTVHASKGLEFEVVFVTGLEQGLFPSEREGGGERDPEEERRLFYVALTRAKSRVFLTHVSERLRWGSREYTLPSEFLGDIDARLLQAAAFDEEPVIE
ncbi:MAG TPA: UvrD-helicase domain-containing protein [Candidatus Paceibacterota bacterium]|nr:UvrD-helicase domain-containing protein [Candidatus Paceibacterota bacterium]